jgi:hypothetical protein
MPEKTGVRDILTKHLGKIPASFWRALGKDIQLELQKRLHKQTGVGGVRFPKKKRPDLSGSPFFLVDTGESAQLDITTTKTGVRVTPRRPEILGYHFDRAPWVGLDKEFDKLIQEAFKKRLAKYLKEKARGAE